MKISTITVQFTRVNLVTGCIICLLGLALLSCNQLSLTSKTAKSELLATGETTTPNLTTDTIYVTDPVDNPSQNDPTNNDDPGEQPGTTTVTSGEQPGTTTVTSGEQPGTTTTPQPPQEPDPVLNVKEVYKTLRAFAFLSKDGSVEAWGNEEYGGQIPSSLKKELNGYGNKDVVNIFSNERAFVALRQDNKLITWGGQHFGGSINSTSKTRLNDNVEILDVVGNSDGNGGAFAALRKDGSIVVWGNGAHGGSFSKNAVSVYYKPNSPAKSIVATKSAFAALKQDGTVYTWGNEDAGGNSSCVSDYLRNVDKLYAGGGVFVAHKKDNTVVVWGGKKCSTKYVDEEQKQYVGIYVNKKSTVIVAADGYAKRWIDSTIVNDEHVFTDNVRRVLANPSSILKTISNDYAFVTITRAGAVIPWGHAASGGDSGSVDLSNIDTDKIVAGSFAFAAIKKNGSVVAWGNPERGGLIDECARLKLTGLVKAKAIAAGVGNFAVIREDNNTVSWGQLDFEKSKEGWVGNYIQGTHGLSNIFGNAAGFAVIFSGGNYISWTPVYSGVLLDE